MPRPKAVVQKLSPSIYLQDVKGPIKDLNFKMRGLGKGYLKLESNNSWMLDPRPGNEWGEEKHPPPGLGRSQYRSNLPSGGCVGG